MVRFLSPSLIMCFGLACAEKKIAVSKKTTVIAAEVSPPSPESKSSSNKRVSDSNATGESQSKRCCQQCAKASSMDPTGSDISMKSCHSYGGIIINGKAPISEDCAEFFQNQGLKVIDCR